VKAIWALLPVKTPERAKTRLASVLHPKECAELSRAMLLDVLAAMQASSHITHIGVLTSDPEVAALIEQLGHTVIPDEDDISLCEGLNKAASYIAAQGAAAILIIPGDIPTVTAADIEQLIKRHCEAHASGLSICPAIRDGGTNALMCSPPDALPFQFGNDSARRHIELAHARGLSAERIPTQAFFRDIDTPEDLVWLSDQETGANTMNYLRESGIFARLGPGLTARAAG
jgi:2-phospho-L-lactate guanylyltransferase